MGRGIRKLEAKKRVFFSPNELRTHVTDSDRASCTAKPIVLSSLFCSLLLGISSLHGSSHRLLSADCIEPASVRTDLLLSLRVMACVVRKIPSKLGVRGQTHEWLVREPNYRSISEAPPWPVS